MKFAIQIKSWVKPIGQNHRIRVSRLLALTDS